MRTASLGLIGVVAVVFGASIAQAYPDFGADGTDDNCQACHKLFGDGPGDPEHDAHRAGISGCSTCHGGFPAALSSPTFPSATGCVGCHGRDADAGADAVSDGFGRGLRQHHANLGITECAGCHTDTDSLTNPAVGEDVAPPLYATFPPLNPCDGSEERFDSDTVSLDNDGDLATDGADPDCGVATTTTTIASSTTTSTTVPVTTTSTTVPVSTTSTTVPVTTTSTTVPVSTTSTTVPGSTTSTTLPVTTTSTTVPASTTSTTAPVTTTTTASTSTTTSTLPGGLVPGGPAKKSSSDCYLELAVAGIENMPPQVEDNKKIFCTDGEACDFGPCGDNVCDMRAGACINQVDPNLPDCTPPAGLDKLTLKNKVNISVPQLLQGPQCGGLVDFAVEARFNKKGKYQANKSRQKVKGKATAPKGTKPRKDSDKWVIQCLPRTVECPGSVSAAFVE